MPRCSWRPSALICSTTFFTSCPRYGRQSAPHLWSAPLPDLSPDGGDQARFGIHIAVFSFVIITSPWQTLPSAVWALISHKRTRNQHRSSPHPSAPQQHLPTFHDRVIHRLFRAGEKRFFTTRIKSRSGSTALIAFSQASEYPGDIFSVLRDSVRRGTGTTAVPVIFAACHIGLGGFQIRFSTNCATSKATVSCSPADTHRDEYSHNRFLVDPAQCRRSQLARFGIWHGITHGGTERVSSAIT